VEAQVKFVKLHKDLGGGVFEEVLVNPDHVAYLKPYSFFVGASPATGTLLVGAQLWFHVVEELSTVAAALEAAKC
jgi:hypothetical protein